MPKTTDEPKLLELREREQVKEIIRELGERAEILAVPKGLLGELKGYCSVAEHLPKQIQVEDRKTVIKAQEALVLLQARLDRVLAIQADCFRIEGALGKLEILLKRDLAEAGAIDRKQSAPTVKQLLGMIVPELALVQQRWDLLQQLCVKVEKHLGEAKDCLRLSIKLDENANWSRRYGGGNS